MAAISNPSKYHIVAFNANFALSGGIVFAKDSGDNYYFVSDFERSDINSRRYPYRGKIEDVSYFFTEDGYTATKMFQLFCVDGIVGGWSGSGSTSCSGEGVPGALTYREKIALQALNGMIQLTPDPLGYKDSTIRLLTQKAFEFADEFIQQSEHVRSETGETGGEGDQLDKEAFEQFVSTFRDAMFTEGQGSSLVYESILAAVKEYMHDALFVTVTEGSSQVEKSVFEIMKDEIIDKLEGIQNANEAIADALTGSGGGSGVMSQLTALNLVVNNIHDAVGDRNNGDTVLTTIRDTNAKVTALDFSTLSSNVSTLVTRIGTHSNGDLNTVFGTIDEIRKYVGHDTSEYASRTGLYNWLYQTLGTASDSGLENTVQGRLQYIKTKVSNL